MKLMDVYRSAIEAGMRNDPRGKEGVDRALAESKKAYDALDGSKKQYFDQERLWNPYADSRFSFGDGDADVSVLMWGIDIGTGEVLLADRLREKGTRIDGIVAHHPTGMARVPFPEVMWVQTDMYSSLGIPINVAESLMSPRMAEVERAVMPSNYNQALDAAKLLGFPLMNIHSPADNCVQRFLEERFADKPPRTLEDIIDSLMGLPEFQIASKQNCPPKIIVGSKTSRAGKVAVKMTGGTSGPKEIYEKMAIAGVGTVIGMHFPESHFDEARKHGINMIVSGHMASDSLGINLVSDIWERDGVKVIPCSGLIRVSRN